MSKLMFFFTLASRPLMLYDEAVNFVLHVSFNTCWAGLVGSGVVTT